MKKASTPSSSQSTSASVAILGKKADVTFEAVLSASKTELPTLFSSCGLSAPVSGLSLPHLQMAFLRSYGIDPSCPMRVFLNTEAARQLQQTVKEAKAVQAGFTDVHEKLERSSRAAADALSASQQECKQHAVKLEQCYRDADSLRAELQKLYRLQNFAPAPASAPNEKDLSCSLRCTGLQEESAEEEEDLLTRVNEVLGKLSSQVEATGARRQGRPGARKGRAVIITFAMPSDRSAVLRTKSELSKIADLRSISIDVVLNAEQQQQKNAQWPMYLQARQNGQRTFWKGCHLFINGQPAQQFCQPMDPMSYEHMNGPNWAQGFTELSSSSCNAPPFPYLPSSMHFQPSAFPTSATPSHQHAQHQHVNRVAGGLMSPVNPLFQHQQPQQQQHRFSSHIPQNFSKLATPLRP